MEFPWKPYTLQERPSAVVFCGMTAFTEKTEVIIIISFCSSDMCMFCNYWVTFCEIESSKSTI
jgi:hypothetical protein